MVSINIYELGQIPTGIETLEDFRKWTASDEFPERGRIDYINGRIEVEMAPDRINSHSLVVSEMAFAIYQIVKSGNLGQVLGSQTRIASVPADLSCEPDIKFVAWESLKSGRVKYVRSTQSTDPNDLLEVMGGPDLVVEVVSPSSVEKDTKLLPSAYYKAGVGEFWLVDARKANLLFTIFRRGKKGFERAPLDRTGYQRSEVLRESFKLSREEGPVENTWIYNLEHHV